MGHKKICYGCGKPGNFLRQCPDRDCHMKRLSNLALVGKGATFLIEQYNEENNNGKEEVLDLVDSFHVQDQSSDQSRSDEDEFDNWLVALLEIHDKQMYANDIN